MKRPLDTVKPIIKATPNQGESLETTHLDLMTFLPNRLAVLSRLTQELLAKGLEQSGLTIAQWRIYLCLVQTGPSTLQHIAEFTQLPQSSLSRSVARMDERGLVLNRRNESDRRISRIEITEDGRHQLANAIREIEKNWSAVLAGSAIPENTFLQTVNTLIQHLSSESVSPPR